MIVNIFGAKDLYVDVSLIILAAKNQSTNVD